MKAQRVNAANLNHMELNNMSNMMGMMNLMQKIGKGKRKIVVKLDKNNKKFLARFIKEVKKQFTDSDMGAGTTNVLKFFEYIEKVVENKNSNEIKFSFEEYEFLKRMLRDSLRGMDTMQFKWYQIVKKGMLKVLKKQYGELLSQFK